MAATLSAVTKARRAPTIDDIVRIPPPGMSAPNSFTFSADDRHLAYLHDPSGGVDQRLFLWSVVDGSTQEVVLDAIDDPDDESFDEQMRRQRLRRQSSGISEFHFAREAPTLAVIRGKRIDLVDANTGAITQVELNAESPMDVRLSPDAALLAYVDAGDLFVVAVEGGPATRLTTDASETGVTRGLAEFIAQEELDRHRGYWWSPDSSRIAYCEVDESPIPEFVISHLGSTDPAEVETHRYPVAGASNAIVRVGVVGATGGDTTWIDLGDNTDFYIARIDWTAPGGLVIQRLSRDQRRLDVFRVDPESGQTECLWSESSQTWVGLHDCYRSLDDGSYVWASERSGFRHLEHRSHDGALITTVTSGPWMVTDLVAVDIDDEIVYFTATKDGVVERHLYSVAMTGREPGRVTEARGVHDIVADHRATLFVDTYSSTTSPVSVTVRRMDGTAIHPLFEPTDPRIDEIDLRTPTLSTVRTTNAELHTRLLVPDGAPPYPTIVDVYGGPNVQRVVDAWAATVSMQAQVLRSRGFAVVTTDNRGSANRGVAFESSIAGQFGAVELDDQIAVVADLIKRGIADPHNQQPGRPMVQGPSQTSLQPADRL